MTGKTVRTALIKDMDQAGRTVQTIGLCLKLADRSTYQSPRQLMRDSTSITRSVKINAPVSRVWKVFTDPAITRHLGGFYRSDWKAGSSISWVGVDGRQHTNGKILQLEPEHLLQHLLFGPDGVTLSEITYEFREHEGQTLLYAHETLTSVMEEEEYAGALAGWDAALQAIKEIAENNIYFEGAR